MHLDGSIGAGISIRTNGRAVQGGEVCAALQEPPKIAGEGADVIAAADSDLELALAREVVT